MFNLFSSFSLISSSSYCVISISIFLLTVKVNLTSGHVGQPCNIFGICWPPSIHIYCDDNHVCRCRPETPVIVGPHQCKRNKSHGDKCSTDQECIYSDNYSFCDSNLCNCVTNYTYDPYLMKCLHTSIQQRSSFNAFYTMLSSAALWIILLLIALFISIPCCLAFLYHCVCYEKSTGDSNLCRDTSIRLRLAESGVNLNEEARECNGNMRNGGDGTRISLRHDELSSRQSYELSCLDEPPPSYDEACKRCQTEPILSEQRNDN
ncbi:uncharacterized protein LOC128392538 [Panonychus citri]|uniref:uncharacterized protein LOC128392538 n=1 Tax=Panonychus citri TaxID=50023 RepID=UPI002307D5C9|nr:uncharacterized protein LOC128392538 [Panonychus citri]